VSSSVVSVLLVVVEWGMDEWAQKFLLLLVGGNDDEGGRLGPFSGCGVWRPGVQDRPGYLSTLVNESSSELYRRWIPTGGTGLQSESAQHWVALKGYGEIAVTATSGFLISLTFLSSYRTEYSISI